MAFVGYLASAVVGIGVFVVAALFLTSIPDLARYRRLRRM